MRFSDSVFPRLFSTSFIGIKQRFSDPPPAFTVMINQRDMSSPGSFIVLMTWSHKLFRPVKLLCISMAYFKTCFTYFTKCKMFSLDSIDLNFSCITSPLFLYQCFSEIQRCWTFCQKRLQSFVKMVVIEMSFTWFYRFCKLKVIWCFFSL